MSERQSSRLVLDQLSDRGLEGFCDRRGRLRFYFACCFSAGRKPRRRSPRIGIKAWPVDLKFQRVCGQRSCNAHNAAANKIAPASDPPKVFQWADEGPPRQADELRRHVYLSGDCPMRIKIKRTGGGFVNWYRVVADGVPVGWQAKKPGDYCQSLT